MPHSAAVTNRMVWISESPDPTSPLRGRPREIQCAQHPSQANRSPLDERELVDLVLAVHRGESHQGGLGEVRRLRSGVPVCLLGAGGVRFGGADPGVCQLRGLKLFVSLGAGV
jgi:hypothetical protein